VSRTAESVASGTVDAGVGAGVVEVLAATGAAAGAAVMPLGFTPYGLGVPGGGDHAP
jgi:hypothetical protein